MTKLKTVLTEARRLLAEVGWVQRYFAMTNDDEHLSYLAAARRLRWSKRVDWCRGFCASSAIGTALFKDAPAEIAEDYDLYALARMRVCAETGDVAVAERNLLARWNDSEGRSKEEVLEAFDKAIAHCPEDL